MVRGVCSNGKRSRKVSKRLIVVLECSVSNLKYEHGAYYSFNSKDVIGGYLWLLSY